MIRNLTTTCHSNQLKLFHIYFGIVSTFRKLFTNFTDGSWIWTGTHGIAQIDKKSFFLGLEHNYKGVVVADLIWKHYVKFYIYQCRLRKKIPTFPSLRYEFEGITTSPSFNNIRANLLMLNHIYNAV